jgi:hypothetical protein
MRWPIALFQRCLQNGIRALLQPLHRSHRSHRGRTETVLSFFFFFNNFFEMAGGT